jgi:UDP-2-acetamido-2-deoxy-ribo-hexuluronate aminotransferase
MQFIDLKSRHQLIGDKINARIQKGHGTWQFILGPEVREVEEKLAEYTGSKHCVTCIQRYRLFADCPRWHWGLGQGTR